MKHANYKKESNALSWLLIVLAVILGGKVLLPLILQVLVTLWMNGG